MKTSTNSMFTVKKASYQAHISFYPMCYFIEHKHHMFISSESENTETIFLLTNAKPLETGISASTTPPEYARTGELESAIKASACPRCMPMLPPNCPFALSFAQRVTESQLNDRTSPAQLKMRSVISIDDRASFSFISDNLFLIFSVDIIDCACQ